MAEVVASLQDVRVRIAAAARSAGSPADSPAAQTLSTPGVTLIAVSKTKPAALVRAAYGEGQCDFGENYVQELVAKAAELPEDVAWHFIGHLQTNKVKELVSVPNLACVHTVDTPKLAAELHKRVAAARAERPLPIFVQINTSGEESKSGASPAEAAALCERIRHEWPSLALAGLMCIGKYTADEGDADADFATLRRCRDEVAADLGVRADELALSMGMSHDFEAAIMAGATHVRVGSTIFGARVYKQKAQGE